jgi:hypothetical protein
MSGYLQRVTASAVRSQPRVHPFVESIFPASRREEPQAFVFQANTQPGTQMAEVPSTKAFTPVMPSNQPAPDSALSSDTAHPRPDPRPKLNPVESVSTPATEPPALSTPGSVAFPVATISADGNVFQPLLPHPGQRAQESNTSLPALPATPAPGSAVRSSSSSRAWIYESIVPQGVPMPSASAQGPRPAETAKQDLPGRTPHINSHRAAAPNAPVRRAPQSQTDEIQIHIGRIEVIAVPPPAPRAVPAPARKALSLDEYLGRNGGRAG